jgi:hypothetical protein
VGEARKIENCNNKLAEYDSGAKGKNLLSTL